MAEDASPGRLRLGVMGGTFDPPHAAHLALAEAAQRQFDLDRVLFVVAGDPWQKRGEVAASADDRLAMTRALIEGHPGFEVSEMEVERSGPTYTADTLEALYGEYGSGCVVFLILGADAASGLSSWKRPDRIRELAHLLIAPRPGAGEALDALIERLRAVGWRADRLEAGEHDISSTAVRDRLAAGERGTGAVRDAVPERVVRVIEERGLYTRQR